MEFCQDIITELMRIRRNKLPFFSERDEGYVLDSIKLLTLVVTPSGNFLALVRQKPNTPEQWAALTKAWEAGYGCEPELEDFQQIVELLWNHQRRVEND